MLSFRANGKKITRNKETKFVLRLAKCGVGNKVFDSGMRAQQILLSKGQKERRLVPVRDEFGTTAEWRLAAEN
jgi:hypothetical protein